MKLSFEFEGNKINYNLVYKKRTSISIQVEPNGNVSVIAPVGTPLFTVADKVKGYGKWIVSEMNALQNKGKNEDQYMYLGKVYGVELTVNEEKELPTVKLARGKFQIETPAEDDSRIGEAIFKWYQDKTKTKVRERSKLFAEAFEKMPKKYEVKVMNHPLWYIEDQTLVFGVNCGVGPLYILDTLLVEALCEFNGIENVTSKLEELVPDHALAQKWVEENHNRFIMK